MKRFPFETTARFLLMDHDSIFSIDVRNAIRRIAATVKIVGLARLGCLHHRYEWVEAV